jgi:hypothetical protein
VDDEWPDFPWIGGTGSMRDLRDADGDQMNPRLSGLRSVSYAAALAMGSKPAQQKPRKVGFLVPRRK